MEYIFKNGLGSSEPVWFCSGRRRKGTSVEKRKGKSRGGIKKRKVTSTVEILQKKAEWVEKRVERQGRGDWWKKERTSDLMEAEEEEKEGKPGSCCFHILSHTPPKEEEEEEKEKKDEGEDKQQKSDLMVNEKLGQETGTSSFRFLSLNKEGEEEERKAGQEKGCKKGKSCSMTTLAVKAEKTGSNRFHILSSALTEELKYELYLVQNL